MQICPKCNCKVERLLVLSRLDNKTMICDECGTKEALDAVGLIEGSSIRKAVLNDAYGRKSPQDRTRQSVVATGNRWAIENFRDTHN